MQLSVISYNLRFHSAYPEVADLVHAHQPDVVCLQEAYTAGLAEQVGPLSLAGLTDDGKVGLAIYVNTSRFEILQASHRLLPKSLHERSVGRRLSRVLAVELKDKLAAQVVYAATLHTAAMSATPGLRRRQINEAFRYTKDLAGKLPLFLIGDYNYPLPKSRLAALADQAGFRLSLPSGATLRRGLYKPMIDFAAIKDIAESNINALPFMGSDHAPILAKLSY